MNLISFDKEIAAKLECRFVFYKGEEKCPFDNMPLSVMWEGERELLYSDKVYEERIRKELLHLKNDVSFCSLRDDYLAQKISMMVSKNPFRFGPEVIEEYIRKGYLKDYKEEMIRLVELSKNKCIR